MARGVQRQCPKCCQVHDIWEEKMDGFIECMACGLASRFAAPIVHVENGRERSPFDDLPIEEAEEEEVF